MIYIIFIHFSPKYVTHYEKVKIYNNIIKFWVTLKDNWKTTHVIFQKQNNIIMFNFLEVESKRLIWIHSIFHIKLSTKSDTKVLQYFYHLICFSYLFSSILLEWFIKFSTRTFNLIRKLLENVGAFEVVSE